MNQPFFSIIIPIYNSNSYLENCLNSIAEQSFRDFEVLLVDDGSTDNSIDICKRFEAIDERFKLIPLKNGGVSRARNVGLVRAIGKYITFIDSDDIVESSLLQTYFDTFCKSDEIDAVKVGFFIEKFNGKTEIISSQNEIIFQDTQKLFIHLENIGYYSFVWNFCIKKNKIKDIRFNEKINWLEDHIFCYECYFNCRKVAVISQPLYHYFKRGPQVVSLSLVKDPEVILKAMTLEYDWKMKLNNYEENDIGNEIRINYKHNIHRLVNAVYRFPILYSHRKDFSKVQLYNYKFLYKEERIFFSKLLPFSVKDKILRFIFNRIR